MKATKILALFGFLPICFSYASSDDISPETVVVYSLVQLMNEYVVDQDGKIPDSWDSLQDAIDLDFLNRGLPDADGYSLQDRYFFLKESIPVPNVLDSKVILVRTAPIHESGAKVEYGRYIIYRKGSELLYMRMPESKIQELFKDVPGLWVSEKGHASQGNKSPVPHVPIARDKHEEPPLLLSREKQGVQEKRLTIYVIIGGVSLLLVMLAVFAMRRQKR